MTKVCKAPFYDPTKRCFTTVLDPRHHALLFHFIPHVLPHEPALPAVVGDVGGVALGAAVAQPATGPGGVGVVLNCFTNQKKRVSCLWKHKEEKHNLDEI